MADFAEITGFLKEQAGVDEVSENDDITDDLCIIGDDFFDLVKAFGKRFNVDISTCRWYFHTAEEGSFNSIGGSFFRPPNERVKHIPVTPLLLLEFANSGKWNIEYPEHTIPKKRYDLIINKWILIIALAFILYKCAS